MSDLVERLRKLAAVDNCQASLEAAARIEQLEAALRAVMDDLTLIGKNHWLPVGLLDDVIYVNARAALDYREMDDHSIGHEGGSCPRERT